MSAVVKVLRMCAVMIALAAFSACGSVQTPPIASPTGPAASATPTPLPTGFAPGEIGAVTATPYPPLKPGDRPVREPKIIQFEVSPQAGLGFGSVVTVSWEVDAQTASIRYDYVTHDGGRSAGDALILDRMKGEHAFQLKPVDALPFYIEFAVEATNGEYDPQTGQYSNPLNTIMIIDVPIRCPYPWFFRNTPQWCPTAEDVLHTAVAQPFEEAQMISIGNIAPMPGSQVIVLFAQPSFWQSYGVTTPGTADAASGVDAAFYGTWHAALLDNAPLSKATGGPSGAAKKFQAHYQCEFPPPSLTISECFFSMPDGKIVRLYINGHYGRNGITWDEWTGN